MLSSLAARSVRLINLQWAPRTAAPAAAAVQVPPRRRHMVAAAGTSPGSAAVHSMAADENNGYHPELDAAKRQVRDAVKAALRQLSAEQMAEESAAIAARVLASPAFRDSPHAVIYVHCARLREVDTTEVLHAAIEQRKRLYVPRVQDKDANMHFLHLDSLDALEAVPPFGIREPRPTYDDGSERQDVLLADEPLELVVMPGLAFDRAGRRLGRGGGYYDKFIAAAQARARERGWAPPLLVALAYRAQLVGQVPVEPHDAGVDAIVTADEVIACTPAAAAVLQPAECSSGGGGGSGASA